MVLYPDCHRNKINHLSRYLWDVVIKRSFLISFRYIWNALKFNKLIYKYYLILYLKWSHEMWLLSFTYRKCLWQRWKIHRERVNNLHEFLLLCVCVCVCAPSSPALYDSMDCNPPGSSSHGIFQARILEWVAFPTPGILPTQESNPHLLCLLH